MGEIEIGVSFEIYNEDSVSRLQSDNPDLLPSYSVDKSEDLSYNKSQINSTIESSIMNGDSVDTIANNLSDRLESVNENSALRTARTAITSAQNGGTLESFYEIQEMGIEIQKEWVCTHDDRTRPSHLELDGERRDLDEEFSNGLQYPGDPDGDPSEVYNCRCTLVAYLPGLDEDTAESAEEASSEEYEEWTREKSEEQGTEQSEAQKTETTELKVSETEVERAPNLVSKDAENYETKIEYNGVHMYETIPTEKQIIEQLAHWDDTGAGSCASQALAYAGQKNGIAVTDLRKGDGSSDFFAEKDTIFNIHWLKGVKSDFRYKSTKPLEETWDMITKMTKGKANEGKEFILTAGHHTAVIKRTGSKTYKYLELQASGELAGWKSLTQKSLMEKFKVTKTSVGNTSIMIDIESLKNCAEFKDILGYLNTMKYTQ